MISRALLVAVLLATGACASTHGNIERSFVRANLDKIPLATVDAFVFVAGPPRVASDVLDVKTFEPPEASDALAVGDPEEATTHALISRVRAELEARGYKVRIVPVFGEVQEQQAQTSSTATSSTSAPASEPKTEPKMEAKTERTLAALRAESDADAILVVRAVPVDAFTIDFGAGTRVEVTALGRERVKDVRPIPHQGRLMLGQAFLIDRKTGLRLWTKQVPDFPDGGRLTENHPFLAYGYVAGPASEGTPSVEERALPAANNFGKKILDDFPSAHAGTSEARAELDAIDPGTEHALQSFFDEGHFALDVGLRYQLGPARMKLALGGTALPDLTTGALMPNGVAVVVPRASYVAAGGWTFAFAVPVGVVPGSFARSYHVDRNDSMLGDFNAAVRVSGGTLFGLEATVGPSLALSPTLMLMPSGGLYYELIAFDAQPLSVVQRATRSSVGVIGGADLWIRSNAASTFFGRVGAAFHAGVDFDAAFAGGVLLSAGVGVFL